MQITDTCKKCSKILTIAIDESEFSFTYTYKGFKDLIACPVLECKSCGIILDPLISGVSEQALAEYESYVENIEKDILIYSTKYISETFEHYKKNTKYLLLFIANLETTDQDLFPYTCVYKDVESGLIWSRPFIEFRDKFKLVTNKED